MEAFDVPNPWHEKYLAQHPDYQDERSKCPLMSDLVLVDFAKKCEQKSAKEGEVMGLLGNTLIGRGARKGAALADEFAAISPMRFS